MKIDDFLKEEMNWTDRDLEYRPVIGYWKVTELLQKWGEVQANISDVNTHFPEKGELEKESAAYMESVIKETDYRDRPVYLKYAFKAGVDYLKNLLSLTYKHKVISL